MVTMSKVLVEDPERTDLALGEDEDGQLGLFFFGGELLCYVDLDHAAFFHKVAIKLDTLAIEAIRLQRLEYKRKNGLDP